MMTPRLLAAASFVKKGSVPADVGTDHAYIPIWLVQKGICPKAIAMDVNRGPLLRAAANIKKFGLEEKISTRLSDGLAELSFGEADTVIIAGMGGILMNRILEQAGGLYSALRHYILQPMTAVEETRKFLMDNGFFIEDECLAREDDKIYTVLSAVRGHTEQCNEIDYYIGKKLVSRRDPLLPAYLDGKLYELEKAICSMRLAKDTETAQKRERFERLRDEMNQIKEACASW